jgi:hypothetical protein
MKRETAHCVSKCDTTIEYSRMKVGRYKHGFHPRLTSDGPQV